MRVNMNPMYFYGRTYMHQVVHISLKLYAPGGAYKYEIICTWSLTFCLRKISFFFTLFFK
jgi:hypothetical protein